MKGLRCSDVVVANCDYVAVDEKDENIKKKLYEHLRKKHKSIFKNMTKDDYERTNKRIDKILIKKFFEYHY